MSEFTADILIVIFVLYFISYLLILKELSYKNALKNENIELDTLTIWYEDNFDILLMRKEKTLVQTTKKYIKN